MITTGHSEAKYVRLSCTPHQSTFLRNPRGRRTPGLPNYRQRSLSPSCITQLTSHMFSSIASLLSRVLSILFPFGIYETYRSDSSRTMSLTFGTHGLIGNTALPLCSLPSPDRIRLSHQLRSREGPHDIVELCYVPPFNLRHMHLTGCSDEVNQTLIQGTLAVFLSSKFQIC
jgi:hypothetical protein